MKTSKDHLDYWKARLRKQKVSREEWETTAKNQDWEIYVQYRGVREWFNLHTSNKEVAASTARDIRRVLVGAGWEEARRRYKPEVAVVLTCPTVGDFLKAVEMHSTLNPVTFEGYARKLRTLAAGIREIPFQAGAGGYTIWKAKVEATKLSSLTVFAIQEWKKSYLRRIGDSPLELARARRTINSILRNAKSLFAKRLLRVVPVNLPTPLPFEGVDFEKVSRPRYRSKVNVRALIQRAESELRTQHQEAYKVFLLALNAGLRRKEIDGLTWRQVDIDGRKISVETTAHTALKNEESEEVIDIPAEVAEILRAYRDASLSNFVISAPAQSKKKKKYPTYRCDESFSALILWLRSQGITDDKPIHMLRKEFGSYIAAEHGIQAASSALRHADISTTSSYYVDKKSPIVFNAAFAG